MIAHYSYDAKAPDYFGQTRSDLLCFINLEKNLKVLEIGAGTGATLIQIKNEQPSVEAHGIELQPITKNGNKIDGIDSMTYGDIETMTLPFENEYFDCIIMGDVLEHLLDPLRTLEKLIKVLKEGGTFIVSVPNIREIRTIYNIFIKGRFEYKKDGILDETHLRFFCKTDIELLLAKANLKKIETAPNYKLAPRRRFLRFIHMGLLDYIFCPQIICVFKK